MNIAETLIPARLTRHAAKRIRQRSISPRTVSLFLRYADRVKPVGDGVVALTFSGTGVRDVQGDGVTGPEAVAKLMKIAVLIDEATDQVITACWLYGHKARAYTRGTIWN